MSSDNGCLILAIGASETPRAAYIPVQWKDGWFDLNPSEPIEAAPGDPLSAEVYVFSKGGQPAMNATSIPLGSNCSAMEPWCLIKLTQPKTAVGSTSISIDFGGENDA